MVFSISALNDRTLSMEVMDGNLIVRIHNRKLNTEVGVIVNQMIPAHDMLATVVKELEAQLQGDTPINHRGTDKLVKDVLAMERSER